MTGEGLEVERQHGELHVGLEGLESGPGAAVQTEGALGRGDDAFDAGTPLSQTFVCLGVPVGAGRVFFSGGSEHDICNTFASGVTRIGLAGESGVGGDLPRHVAELFFVPVEGGNELGGVGGVAAFDGAVENQVALAAGEQDLVSVENFALAFLDDIGVGFEDGKHLLAGRDVFPQQDTAPALVDDPLGEREEFIELRGMCGSHEHLFQTIALVRCQGFQCRAAVVHGLLRQRDQPFIQRFLVSCPRVLWIR